MRIQKTLLVGVVLFTGCHQEQSESKFEIALTQNKSFNACELVLAASDSETDNSQLFHLQDLIKKDKQPIINLEKLGWAYVALARNNFDEGYYSLAQQTANCLEQKQENHPAALLLKGHVLHQLHQFKQAEVIARKLIQQRGHWFEYGLLGDALMEQGRLNKAAQAYQQMMNQRPGPQVYTRAAHLRWLKGDLEGAIEMMQLTLPSAKNSKSESAAWLKTRLGYYLFVAKDYEGAYELINSTLSLRTDYAPALFLQGRVYLSQNQIESAIHSLTRATKINPLPEYQWFLLEALQSAGNSDQVNAVKNKLIRNAIQRDPRTYSLYLASSKSDTKLALKLANEELKQRQDIFTLDAVAWAQFANSQIDNALQTIENALAEDTQEARLFYHAAVINQAAGNKSKAIHYFEKAYENLHTLMPSEQQALLSSFEGNVIQKKSFAADSSAKKNNSLSKGDHHENNI